MKTVDEMVKDMREALAHHKAEAARLEAGIAALEGKPPLTPLPPVAPFVYPWPPPAPTPIVPWVVTVGDNVICGGGTRLDPNLRFTIDTAPHAYAAIGAGELTSGWVQASTTH